VYNNTLASTVVASLLHSHLIHDIIMLLAHIWFIYQLGHVCVKPESEVQLEQAQVEASTNFGLDQGKPRCIKPPSLTLNLNLYLLLR
jgi:hypothetical protein